jgi:hypothetical protein
MLCECCFDLANVCLNLRNAVHEPSENVEQFLFLVFGHLSVDLTKNNIKAADDSDNIGDHLPFGHYR